MKTCKWCGKAFTRREDESSRNYRIRLTCSPTCKASRLAEMRRQRLLSERRALSREIGEVPLPGGEYAYVDPEDFDRVMQHLWHIITPPDTDRRYAATRINGKMVRMHRFILGASDEQIIDHADRDGLNNRRSNLRYATTSQNAMNRKPYRGTASGYKGVVPLGNKWRVMFQRKHAGLFDTPEEAARAYDELARRHFGRFARTNFPEREGLHERDS